MRNHELKSWLRENSSGSYRPSAEAADLIDELELALAQASETIKRLMQERDRAHHQLSEWKEPHNRHTQAREEIN